MPAYRVTTPKIISETIDGEAIIINLDTGDYFSLNPSGSLAWELLTSGWPLETVSEAMAQKTGQAVAEVTSRMGAFVSGLEREGLIVAADVGVDVGTLRLPDGLAVFEAPEFQKYVDMQDLLLLDPVHDVEEAGWPARKKM
ncbi:MAG: PqqD family protein [bacterium]